MLLLFICTANNTYNICANSTFFHLCIGHFFSKKSVYNQSFEHFIMVGVRVTMDIKVASQDNPENVLFLS